MQPRVAALFRASRPGTPGQKVGATALNMLTDVLQLLDPAAKPAMTGTSTPMPIDRALAGRGSALYIHD